MSSQQKQSKIQQWTSRNGACSVAAAAGATVMTEIAASNGAVAEKKDVDVAAGAEDDDDEEAEGDAARRLEPSETVGFAAKVLTLGAAVDPVALALVTEQSMCDPGEPPAECETFRWTRPPELASLLR